MLENWKLIEVVNRTWKQDTSGVYSTINYTKDKMIRLDLMSNLDMPIVGIKGPTCEAVYKGLADYLDLNDIRLSMEHSMYIGKELQRCEVERGEYKQD